MTHDPLCSLSDSWENVCEGYFCDDPGGTCRHDFCQCDLINSVREDERRQAVERVRDKKGKFPSTRLDWDTIVIAILDGTKLRLSKKELNEQS